MDQPQAVRDAPEKFWLFTAVNDYEGQFADLEEYDSAEEAMNAAIEFQKLYPRDRDYGAGSYKILRGALLLEG